VKGQGSVEEIDNFEEEIYLKLYSFWKRLLVLPWCYILLMEGVLEFIPPKWTVLLFIIFFFYLILYSYLLRKEEKKFISKGRHLFAKLSL
jgi:hypothetical protein